MFPNALLINKQFSSFDLKHNQLIFMFSHSFITVIKDQGKYIGHDQKN